MKQYLKKFFDEADGIETIEFVALIAVAAVLIVVIVRIGQSMQGTATKAETQIGNAMTGIEGLN